MKLYLEPILYLRSKLIDIRTKELQNLKKTNEKEKTEANI